MAELKASLSKYLEKVKAGQQVLVTERGRPIAKLVPLEPDERRDGRKDRLVKAGLIQPGTGKKLPRSLVSPPKGPASVGKGVLEALLAEREEGR